MKLINSYEISKKVIDCMSDRYNDEKDREEAETVLYNELSQVSNNSFVKVALIRLCERIEELEQVN